MKEYMIYLYLLSALIVGVSMGILGSGGSILTVPILVYILHRPEKLAILESLAIVGVIAFVSAFSYGYRKQIDWKSVCFFGLPGIVGAYFGASQAHYISDRIQLILFSLTMLGVAYAMLREGNLPFISKIDQKRSVRMTMFQGFLVGTLTGLIGAGGGFIIVPTLTILRQLDIKRAIGTSLVIITMNTVTGFIQQWISLHPISMESNWVIIFVFALFGIIGSLVGSYYADKIPQKSLKKLFGVCVFCLGFLIFFEQFSQSIYFK